MLSISFKAAKVIEYNHLWMSAQRNTTHNSILITRIQVSKESNSSIIDPSIEWLKLCTYTRLECVTHALKEGFAVSHNRRLGFSSLRVLFKSKRRRTQSYRGKTCPPTLPSIFFPIFDYVIHGALLLVRRYSIASRNVLRLGFPFIPRFISFGFVFGLELLSS